MSTSITRALRNIPRNVPNLTVATPSINALRVTARNAQYPSVLGDIFDAATFTVVNNRVLMNNVDMSIVERTLKRGQLMQFARLVDSPLPVNNRAQNVFRKTLLNVPDNFHRQVDDAITRGRLQHGDLDIPITPDTTGESLRNSMTPAARSKFEGAMTKIRAAAGATGVAVGVFALIIIGVDFYQSAVEATLNRRGCVLMISQNNTMRTCRLLSRTCWDPRLTQCDPGTVVPTDMKFNTTIMLINAINSPGSALAAQLGVLLGFAGPLTADNVNTVMTDPDLFQLVYEFYMNNDITLVDVCGTNAVIEGGEQQLCRACDTTFNIDSTQHFDDSELADNVALACIPSGSLVDTIIDVGIGIGVDVLSPFANISNSASENWLWILIAVVVLIVIVIITSIFKKK